MSHDAQSAEKREEASTTFFIPRSLKTVLLCLMALAVDLFSNMIVPVWLLITASPAKNPYYTESLIS
jgi:hypothetical protein